MAKSERLRTLVIGAFLAAGFGLSAWGCMLNSQLLHGMCAVWTANAFLITGLVVLPRRWRPSFTMVCVALHICAHLITGGRSLVASGLLTLINVGEAVTVAYLFNRYCYKRLNTPMRLAKYLLVCLAPVMAVGSAAGAAVMSNLLHHDFVQSMRLWFAACFLGSAVLVPMLLILFRPSPQSSRFTLPAAVEAILGLACFTFMFLSPNLIVRSAAIILSFPAVTAFAFRRGPKAAAAAAVMVGAITLPVILARPPADLLMRASSFEQRAVLMQIYIAAVFFSALATALAVEELRRMRKLLERRTVSARRARVAAEAASLAKTEFLATMSHEIRTPMNSIIGFTEVILRRDDLADEARRQLGMVERSGEALLTVVNDILDFSKVEAGQVELNPRPSQVDAIARDAAAIVAETAERKGLELILALDIAPGVSYLADDHRLRQILLNLLNNAIKFTDKGSIRLEVTAKPFAETCDLVRFAVTDTGCGIPVEALPRLFQRFSQADNSITRTHGGSGLGLAICKALAELMGGRVGVDSVVGEGSTFWIEVPLVSAEVVSETVIIEEGRAVAAHVLLVDDHPMNRELGVTVLSLLGCTADVACDGIEAIAKAKANHYDAILMDVHMPQMDGLAATRAIRLIQGPAGATPIIAMSADVMPEQIARMREAGMVDSVGKPISIEALNDALTRWVGRDSEGETRAA